MYTLRIVLYIYMPWAFGWVDELLQIENTQHVIIIYLDITIRFGDLSVFKCNGIFHCHKSIEQFILPVFSLGIFNIRAPFRGSLLGIGNWIDETRDDLALVRKSQEINWKTKNRKKNGERVDIKTKKKIHHNVFSRINGKNTRQNTFLYAYPPHP